MFRRQVLDRRRRCACYLCGDCESCTAGLRTCNGEEADGGLGKGGVGREGFLYAGGTRAKPFMRRVDAATASTRSHRRRPPFLRVIYSPPSTFRLHEIGSLLIASMATFCAHALSKYISPTVEPMAIWERRKSAAAACRYSEGSAGLCPDRHVLGTRQRSQSDPAMTARDCA